MKKLTLTKVVRKEVDGKFGVTTKVGVQTKEHGKQWLSCFDKNNQCIKWKEGDTVVVSDIVENKKDDMVFLNIVLPKDQALFEMVCDLAERVSKLEAGKSVDAIGQMFDGTITEEEAPF